MVDGVCEGDTLAEEMLDGVAIAHRFADVGGVRLHFVEAGKGPLVVLLHGFPEFWYSWRHQIPALVRAGFRVVAPDMRGYNLSDKPHGKRHYHTDRLARDVAQLIAACGEERAAAVVGHDWGAAVAWQFAMSYPEKLERLAILNVPHPLAMMRMWRYPRQWLRSWYIFFFQLPWLPEASFRARNFRTLRRVFVRGTVTKGAFTPPDIDRYVEAFARPGALTAAINYYRALLQQNPFLARKRLRVIERPVQIIWGMQDIALGPELADPPRRWVPNYDIERLPDSSHWVQNDQPRAVNEILLRFVNASSLTSRDNSE